MDENIPQIRYELGNYSQGTLYFRLPYWYSRPFVIANWTVNLYNPSQNESTHVYISMFSDPMEDAGIIEKISIDFAHQWPLIAILTLWFYTGVSMHIERSRRPAGRVQIIEHPEDGGSCTAQENPEQI